MIIIKISGTCQVSGVGEETSVTLLSLAATAGPAAAAASELSSLIRLKTRPDSIPECLPKTPLHGYPGLALSDPPPPDSPGGGGGGGGVSADEKHDVWWPGDIEAFLIARRAQQAGWLGAIGSRLSGSFSQPDDSGEASKSLSKRSGTVVLGRAATAGTFGGPTSVHGHRTASTGKHAEEGEAAIALQLQLMRAYDANKPSGMQVHVGGVELGYSFPVPSLYLPCTF